jgi:hypothetical protein
MVASDARRLVKSFASLLEECPARIPEGQCRGSKQNFICLAARLQNQLREVSTQKS